MTDGFASTQLAMKALFPLIFIGNCLLHAAKKLSSKIKGVSSETRDRLSRKFSKVLFTPPKLSGLEVFTLAQRLRHFISQTCKEAGENNAQTVREWIAQRKQAWFETLRHRKMPKTSTKLDQAHNHLDRKLFMMKHFHHKQKDKEQFTNALAVLYNFIPYQKRAKNSNLNGVEVQGGTMPHSDWFFSLMILTSAGGMIRSD